MQLHPHVQAHRSAAGLYYPQPHLSVTLGTLPPGKALICREIAPGHWLVIVRDGAEYGDVALAYALNDKIPPWIGPRIYGIFGVTSPAVDLAAYHRTRWWDLSWPVSPTSAHILEDVGGPLITPWPHEWLAA